MKSPKRILSTILTLIIVLSSIPFSGMLTASASEMWQQPRGTIFTFGSYPQSKVTNSSTISSLNGITKNWISYRYYSGSGTRYDGQMTSKDYMKYADISYGGNKYRAVTFTSYRPYLTGYTSSTSNSYQGDNGYYTNNVYYFKYEPLEWRILDPEEGLVMCETIIDSQPYNNYLKDYNYNWYGNSSCTYYASDYKNSSIRQWLNNDFYNTAFSSSEKSKILISECENKATWSSQYDSETTYDKIFLLSYWDAINSSYGFSSDRYEEDTARRARGTDYAKCQGLYVSTFSSDYGNSFWRLRSPGDSYYAWSVHSDGYAGGGDSDNTDNGIRPAFKSNNLKSNIYTVTYNANGGSVSPATDTATPDDSVTLLTPTKKFTVTFDANGGTGAPSNQSVSVNCKGWSKTSTSTTATYTCGSTFKPTADTTLYAVWNTSATANLTTTKPTRDGYTFQGWSTSSTATTPTYTSGASITVSANIKLYAVWKSNTVKYTVTYNSNGGSVSPANETIVSGDSVTLPTPTKKFNITFDANGGTGVPSTHKITVSCKGWTKSSTSTTATYACGSTFKPTADTTLYAVWDTPVSAKLSSTKPTREGYTFKGWALSKTATTPDYSAGENISLSDSITLYALWKKPGAKVNGVTLDENATLNYKKEMRLTPNITADVGADYAVTWSSDNPSIATVDNNGNVKGVKRGSATITCTVTDDVGNAFSDTCKVEVKYAWWQWLIKIILFGWIWY